MNYNHLNHIKSGSAQGILNSKTLSKVLIPVPSMDEQKKIVAILERTQKLKEERNLANEDTNRIIQSLFYRMFGNNKYPLRKISEFVDKKIKTRDPRKNSNKVFTYVDISGIDNKRGLIVESQKLKGSEAPSRARRVIK